MNWEWLFQTLASNLVIACLLAAGAFLCGRIPRLEQLAYGLWLLFFVKLVTPSWVSVDYIYPGSRSESGIQASQETSLNPAGIYQVPTASPDPALPSLLFNHGQAAFVDSAISQSTQQIATLQSHESSSPLRAGKVTSLTFILTTVWGTGAVFMSWIAIRHIRKFRRLIHLTEPDDDMDLQSRVRRLARQCGLRRVPESLIFSTCLSPGVAWTPGGYKILIPSGFWSTLTGEEKDLAILHEIGHLKRGDCLRRIFEIPFMVIFWWFPVAWLATRELRRLEELLCDRWVQKNTTYSPGIYAGLLVNFLEYISNGGRKPVAGFLCTLACRGLNNHKNRISLIIENRRPAFLTQWVVCACLVMVGIVLIPVSLRPQNETLSPILASSPTNVSAGDKSVRSPILAVPQTLSHLPGNISSVSPKAPDSPMQATPILPDNPFNAEKSPEPDLVFGVQSVGNLIMGDWSWRNPDHPSDYATLQFLPHNVLNIENNELPHQKGSWSVDGRNVRLLIEEKLALQGVYRDGRLHFDINQSSNPVPFVFTKNIYKPVKPVSDVSDLSPEKSSSLAGVSAIPEPLNDFILNLNMEFEALSALLPESKNIHLSADSHVQFSRNNDSRFPPDAVHPLAYEVYYVSGRGGLTDFGKQVRPFRFSIRIFQNAEGRADFKCYMAGDHTSEFRNQFFNILHSAINELNHGDLDLLFP